MSLRHLFAGIMFGVFAMALGSNPEPQATDVAIPGVAVADKAQGGSTKPASKSDDKLRERQPETAPREASTKNEKPAVPERTWAQRLVFPVGNKF